MTRHETQEWSVDAAAIDRARILRGWTRRDLARQAHVDEGTLCDFFAGRRHPTFGTLRALCRVLDVGFDEVICFGARLKSQTAGLLPSPSGIQLQAGGVVDDVVGDATMHAVRRG